VRGTTILVADASVETERASWALKELGYSVVEVPLALLVSRVASHHPVLALVDADAEEALAAVRRLRVSPGGDAVEILFIGEPDRTFQDITGPALAGGSGFLPRPIDQQLLVRKVQALAPLDGAAAGAVTGVETTGAFDARGATPVTPAPEPLFLRSEPGAGRALVEPEPSNWAPTAGGQLSGELLALLARAEERVQLATSTGSMPSPEEEVDAVLPAELLEALDDGVAEAFADEDDGTWGNRPLRSMPAPSLPPDSIPSSPFSELPPADEGPARPWGEVAGSSPPPPALAEEPAPVSAARGQPDVSTRIEARAERPSRSSVEFPEPASSLGPGARAEPISPPAPAASRALTPAPNPVGGPSPAPAVSPAFGPLLVPSPAMPRLSTPLPGLAPLPGLSLPAAAPAVSAAPAAPAAPAAALSPVSLPVAALPVFSVPAAPAAPAAPAFSLPEPVVLAAGDAGRLLAQAIAERLTGCLCFEGDSALRRIVLRDGDICTSGSSHEEETLLAFLENRGDLPREVTRKLVGKLPPFGRHAGAALVAHGHLAQDSLWDVLRAHAEWLIGRVVSLVGGLCSLEAEAPGRLRAEPSVFGGSTGAEVFVEVVRRVVPPPVAAERLGGRKARVGEGRRGALLAECALPAREAELLERSRGFSLGELLDAAPEPEFAAVIYAVVLLGVIERLAPAGAASEAPPAPRDELDDEAIRARVRARLDVVEEGDYFAVLGVSRAATPYEIKRAYLDLRRSFEPSRVLTAATAELSGSLQLILEVLDEAYEVLRDATRRERYRRAIEAGPPGV
jgi:hypothetical protein